MPKKKIVPTKKLHTVGRVIKRTHRVTGNRGNRRLTRNPRVINKQYGMTPFGEQYGSGFFKNLWKGLKKGTKASVKFARRTKILSRALGTIDNPKAKTAAVVLSAIGLGKARRKITRSKSCGRGLGVAGGAKYIGRPRKVGRPTKRRSKTQVKNRRKKGSGLKLAGAGKLRRKKVFP